MSPCRPIAVLAVVCLLGACGMKGPLVMPPPPAAKPAPAAVDTPSQTPQDTRK